MNLTMAQKYTGQIVEWVRPWCERVEIAGSTRRGAAVCNDIDLVVIPKIAATRDLLGESVWKTNLLHTFLAEYVGRTPEAKWLQGENGAQEAKQFLIQLPKCQLDIFLAEQHNFGARLLHRTGSKQHNIQIAQMCIDRGMHWNPYEGIFKEGRKVSGETEESFYRCLGLAFIEPNRREFLKL